MSQPTSTPRESPAEPVELSISSDRGRHDRCPVDSSRAVVFYKHFYRRNYGWSQRSHREERNSHHHGGEHWDLSYEHDRGHGLDG